MRLALDTMHDHKAENLCVIDISEKSSLADQMIIASARSRRHAAALAGHFCASLKKQGIRRPEVEGLDSCDWVLVDAGEVIVHIFRPEIRLYYDLERLWQD